MDEQLRHWIVYMYTFPNGKRYVGKTKRTLAQRQGAEFKGYRHCTLLWNAIQKYGVENIKQEVLFEGDATDIEAAKVEQEYILLFKTNCNRFNNPAYGYNLTDGGDGLTGWRPDEERLIALREQLHKLHLRQIGSHRSDEAKEKMRQAKFGKSRGHMSDETKAKISRANSSENMSEETRAKRRASKFKPLIATHNETGESITFQSAEEAANYFGVRSSAVSRWCYGTRKPSVNYTFHYLSTNND